MNNTYNSNLKNFSRSLRKNMTKEERKLWNLFLKTLPITINRQKVIGEYIVDFYCAKYKVVIEIDGGQHFDEEGIARDKARDKYLNDLGLRVLRYNNLDVDRNFEGVCEDILNNLR